MKKLPPITEWIKESFTIYFKKDNFIYLTKFALLQLLFTSLIFVFLFITTGVMGTAFGSETPDLPPGLLIPFILTVIIVVILNIWVTVATVMALSQVVEGKILGVGVTMKLARARILPYFFGSILRGIFVLVGLVLLIIPGIIFIVWFYFAELVIVTENVGPVKGLMKSKELVKGYFWPLLGRLLVMLIYAAVINFLFTFLIVPMISTAIITLLAPYFQLLPFLLFKELKEIKKA